MPRSVALVEKDLSASLEERVRLLSSARESLGRLNGLSAAALTRAVKRSMAVVNGLSESTSRTHDPTAYNWNHPLWHDFQPVASDTPLDRVRLAGVDEGQLLPGELPFDGACGVPMFDGEGAIVLVHDDATQVAARASLQSLLLRIALGAPGQVRFTLLDPTGMGSAYPFRGFLGRDVVRTAGRMATDELAEALEDIRRINERVIGHAPRFSALTPEQRSGETFEVVALADFPRAYSKDPRAVECLVRIGNAGPRAGRHLIMEWNADANLPHDFRPDQLENAMWIDFRKAPILADDPPGGSEQKRLIDLAYATARRREGGDWNTIVRPATFLQEDAADRVATPLGERLRFWLGENEEGKPSAHAMVAGQTGSGKSYLLHVLITGLAARYSPSQLRFTLIDGKQGVEFEAYRSLPHADVVCLRTGPALARSVLADFVTEMEDRYEKFQTVGVVKLRDYRLKTGEVLPRRLLVIDEYQQILDGDPETGALLLGKLLEKGRAAGMHAVLGSQTFEQRGLPQSALTHIHTWASMSLQEAYAQSLQVFGSEGKRLIRDLGATGEVVVNDEGGRDGANSRGAVARLRRKDGEDLLGGIVEEIIKVAGGPGQAIVLSGREGALVSDNPHLVQARQCRPTADELQLLARMPVRQGGFGIETWNNGDRPLPLWLGRRFDVRGHALCVLRRAPAQNVLVLGTQTEARSRMLAFSLASLCVLIPPESLEICFFDGLREDMPGGGMMAAGLSKLADVGVKVVHLTEETLEAALTTLEAASRTPDPTTPTRLLVVCEPDYLYSLHGGADRFTAPTSGPTVLLRTILQRGPQAGVHTIVSAAGLTSFQLVFSPSRESALFNHRIVQQMNEEESMSLFSSLLAARLQERADHPFAALHIDQIAGVRNAVLFNQYCANRALGGDQSLGAMNAELVKLRYPGQ